MLSFAIIDIDGVACSIEKKQIPKITYSMGTTISLGQITAVFIRSQHTLQNVFYCISVSSPLNLFYSVSLFNSYAVVAGKIQLMVKLCMEFLLLYLPPRQRT